ncbi:SDR family oxidoreductase [Actinomadura sp. NPDC048955]|uniref:NAD(P)-dependent dehydrogenase (Short-subunit alcohol dehydrogenase family) n=1 Tax=Actinomadura luteofluorescens TaxID=46163 RepID=A0A7Y9EKQ4_9ACTN|nr:MULTISPECIES: SDR family oxidoreductase [Actinomadura]MCR3741738.1 NAD(P)-dependent dehydrogenase, short-chain alcohol dehydrogenase family [Actinomadura glauciflava]NYD49571.1 NAD(P)-dependent dehydrogenase (short-subunit alcohol dehydrogenase family) [Actinomadura luteofluorescens]
MRTGLEGKTALITGASRGIGKAIATALAAEGANVVLSSRKQEALDEVAKEIAAAHPGAGVLAKAAHVGDAEQAAACVDAAVAEFGGLDVLVNNAGTNPYFGPMADIEPAAAAKTVQVNQFAIVQWTQLALRASLAERGGAIINIASVGGMMTEHGIGYYNATKAAVIHLSRQFAMELAPKVRVNCIAPGLVKTHLARALWEDNEAEISRHMPLGRLGEPEDIADAAVFLAGDASSWMTGQTLVVDGGATIRASIA